MVTTETFPLDWGEWHAEWQAWLKAHEGPYMRSVRKFKPGKNFLADDILGCWQVPNGLVELSEVTFPNLSERDPQTGRLLDFNTRYVGVTWSRDGEQPLVRSFDELEEVLGL